MTAEQQRAIDYAVGMIYRNRNSLYLEMVARVKIKDLLAQWDADLTALREENERLRARVNEAETAAAKLILAVQAKVPNIFTDSEVDMNLYTSIHELKGILNK
jgi:hypothetical protein